jgi:hypothetical protein
MKLITARGSESVALYHEAQYGQIYHRIYSCSQTYAKCSSLFGLYYKATSKHILMSYVIFNFLLVKPKY